MTSNNKLNIMNWNSRSLKPNEDEFFNFLRVHDVHIAVVTETFLKEGVQLKWDPDFLVHRNDRSTGAGGGVAIAIRRRMKYNILPDLKTRVFESLGIEIETCFGKLFVAAVYLPFQCTGEQKNFLKGDLNKLTRNKSKFLIIGDFNAKHRSWNNAQSNSNGRLLFNDCTGGHYSILFPNGPTCFSSARNPSTIDLVLTDQGHMCDQLVTHADFDSDHLPVTFSLSQEAVLKPVSSVFNYHRANWDEYTNFIEENFDHNLDLQTKADIDAALEALTNCIIEARNFAIPKIQVKFDSPIIDDDRNSLIRFKNLRRRQYQRTRRRGMKILCTHSNGPFGANTSNGSFRSNPSNGPFGTKSSIGYF